MAERKRVQVSLDTIKKIEDEYGKKSETGKRSRVQVSTDTLQKIQKTYGVADDTLKSDETLKSEKLNTTLHELSSWQRRGTQALQQEIKALKDTKYTKADTLKESYLKLGEYAKEVTRYRDELEQNRSLLGDSTTDDYVKSLNDYLGITKDVMGQLESKMHVMSLFDSETEYERAQKDAGYSVMSRRDRQSRAQQLEEDADKIDVGQMKPEDAAYYKTAADETSESAAKAALEAYEKGGGDSLSAALTFGEAVNKQEDPHLFAEEMRREAARIRALDARWRTNEYDSMTDEELNARLAAVEQRRPNSREQQNPLEREAQDLNYLHDPLNPLEKLAQEQKSPQQRVLDAQAMQNRVDEQTDALRDMTDREIEEEQKALAAYMKNRQAQNLLSQFSKEEINALKREISTERKFGGGEKSGNLPDITNEASAKSLKLSEEDTALLREYLDEETKREEAEAQDRIIRELATSNFFAGAGMTLLSVPANLIGGVFATAATAGQAIDNALTGKDEQLDTNSDAFLLTNFAQSVRGGITDAANDVDKSGFLSFLYGTGTSMLDSLGTVALETAAPGMGGAVGLGMMGASASASTIKDSIERGASLNQALVNGLLQGAVEVVTEKVSLENLLKPKGMTSAVARVLQQAGVEASEETAAGIADLIIEGVVMRDKSEYNKEIEAYLASGTMTRREAEAAATRDMVGQVMFDTLGGALSGGVMGGGAALIQQATHQDDFAYYVEEETKKLKQEGFSGDIDAEAKFLAIARMTEENAKRNEAKREKKADKQAAREARKSGQDAQETSYIKEDVEREADVTAQRTAAENRLKETAKEGASPLSFVSTGNNVKIKTADGKTVNEQEVKYESETQRKLFERASRFNPAQANAFLSQYDGSMSVEEYDSAYNAFVRAERLYDSFDDVLKKGGEVYQNLAKRIGESTAKLAYTVAFNADQNITIRQADRARVDREGGVVRNYSIKPTAAQKIQIDTLEAIGQTWGVAIEVVDDIGMDANGVYNTATKRVTIGLNTLDRAILRTASHEMYHYIEQNAPNEAKDLREYVTGKLKQNANYNYEAKKKWLLKNGYNEENVDAEITADAMFDVLNEETIEQLAKENPSVFKRILAHFEHLIMTIENAIDRIASKRANAGAEIRALRGEEETLKTIRKKFVDAMEKIRDEKTINAETSSRAQNKKTAAEADNTATVKRSATEYEFARDIDEWRRDGRPEGVTFVLGTTGDVLQGLGAMEADIYMQGDKIQKILNKHKEMTLAEIKKIPQIIDDPVLILASRNVGRPESENTRLVMFGSVKATNGKPILVILDLLPIENGLALDDMQKVVSSYTKTTKGVTWLKTSKFMYLDKKGAAPLLRKMLGITITTSEVRDYGFIGSITYTKDGVKFSGKSFSEIFGEAAETPNTSIKFSAMDSYPYDMQTVIQGYLDGVDEKLVRFVEDIQKKKPNHAIRHTISNVTAREAADISRLLKVNVSGYTHNINESAVQHIEKRHGIHGESDSSMRYIEDVARIGWVLENYDEVDILRDKKGNQVYSKEFRDKNGRRAPMLQYTKRINGTFFVIEAACENGRNRLWTVSAYINGKIGIKNESTVTQEGHATRPSQPTAFTLRPKTKPPIIGASEDIVTRENDGVKKNIKKSTMDKDAYSYDTLTSKPDMQMTLVRNVTYSDRSEIVRQAKKNAAAIGGVDQDGTPFVHVNDIDTDVLIGTDGIKHGLTRNFSGKAAVMVEAGSILRNSVRINELEGARNGAAEAYILMGAAYRQDGTVYIVRSVVNRYTQELDSVDVLYALNIKKEGPARLSPRFAESGDSAFGTGPTVSIADLLESVNKNFPDILSEDVLQHFGHTERPQGVFNETIRFSTMDKEERNLLQENEQLKKAIAALKREFKLTNGMKVSDEAVKSFAEELILENHSSMNADELAPRLTKVFDYIASDPEKNGEAALSAAWEIARNLLETSRDNAPVYREEYADAREYLKGKRISIPEKEEMDKAQYNAIRKRLFGRLPVSNKGMPYDVFAQEFVEKFPEFREQIFGETGFSTVQNFMQNFLNVAEQVYEKIIPKSGTDFETDALYLAMQIFNSYMNLPQYETFDAEIDAMKRQYWRRMNAFRKEISDRYEGKLRNLKREYEKKEQERFIKEERQTLLHGIETISRRIVKRLVNPTDQRNIPMAYRVEIAKILQGLNFGTAVRLGNTLSESERLYAKAKKAIEQIVSTKAQKLTEKEQAQFDEMNIDPDMKANIEIANERLEELMRENGNKPVALEQVDLETLYTVRDVMLAAQSAVTNYGKLLSEKRKGTVSGLAQQIYRDNQQPVKLRGAIRQTMKNVFTTDMMTVDTYFHAFGEGGDRIWEMLKSGEKKMVERVREAFYFMQNEAYRDIKDVEAFKKRINSKSTVEISFAEGKVTFTKQQLMELYALSRREQAMQHMEKGGIVTGTMKKGVKVTRTEVWRVVEKHLTEEERSFVDRIQRFTSTTEGEWGNEVTRTEFGYEKFTDPHYWRINVDKRTVPTNDKSVSDKAGMWGVRNFGATKKLNEKAINPIRIGNLLDTFSEHTENMARYNGYGLVVRDMMNWYNYQSAEGEGANTKKVIENVYGVGSVSKKNAAPGKSPGSAYFEKFMQDLSGQNGDAEVTATRILNKMASGYKAAAMGLNFRVAMQQPTAVVRAMDMISPKYFAKSLMHKGAFKEAARWSTTAQLKSWGFMENALSTEFAKVITGDKSGLDTVKDNAMIFAAKADEVTWGHIWEACKRKIDAEQKKADKDKRLKKGSDAYFEAVAELFDNVTYQTQVFDSVLTRSQNMRSDNALIRLSTAFTSEPSKSYNMLLRELMDFRKSGKKMPPKRFFKKLSAIVASQALAAMAAAAASAFRDDDDYKTWLEKWQATVGKEFVGNINPFSAVPIASELSDWLLSKIGAVEDYGNTDMYWTALESTGAIIDGVAKMIADGDYSSETMGKLLNKTARTLSQLTGVPVYNVMRELSAIWNAGMDLMHNRDIKWRLSSYNSTADSVLYTQLFDAMGRGDTTVITRVQNELAARGTAQDKIDSGLKKIFYERYEQDLLTAAGGRRAGDIALYEEKVEELMEETGLDRRIVLSAIDSALKRIEDEEEATKPTEKPEEKEPEEVSAYSTADVNRYLEAGNTDAAHSAIEDIVAVKVANGKDDKTARSNVKTQVTAYWKPLYIEAYEAGNESEMLKIRELLFATGLYGGKNETVKTVSGWVSTWYKKKKE